jgi:O-antigen ligase
LATLKQLIPGTDEQVIHLDSSFEQRKLYMKAAWSMFNKRTIAGVGAGNYSEHFQQQAQEVGAVVSSYEDFGKRRYPHSLYLEIAAETGLVGLVLFGSTLAQSCWEHF